MLATYIQWIVLLLLDKKNVATKDGSWRQFLDNWTKSIIDYKHQTEAKSLIDDVRNSTSRIVDRRCFANISNIDAVQFHNRNKPKYLVSKREPNLRKKAKIKCKKCGTKLKTNLERRKRTFIRIAIDVRSTVVYANLHQLISSMYKSIFDLRTNDLTQTNSMIIDTNMK